VVVLLEKHQDMIIVALVRDEFQDQGWSPAAADCHGCEQSPIEAMCLSFPQDSQWAAIEIILAVWNAIQKVLDFNWAVQTVQYLPFRRIKL
jgi:hypothetical protein